MYVIASYRLHRICAEASAEALPRGPARAPRAGKVTQPEPSGGAGPRTRPLVTRLQRQRTGTDEWVTLSRDGEEQGVHFLTWVAIA